MTNPLLKEQWAHLPWCASPADEGEVGGEGVCGCGGEERHMHCSVAEPCRMETEELVGISHTIGQVYIVWLVSVYLCQP